MRIIKDNQHQIQWQHCLLSHTGMGKEFPDNYKNLKAERNHKCHEQEDEARDDTQEDCKNTQGNDNDDGKRCSEEQNLLSSSSSENKSPPAASQHHRKSYSTGHIDNLTRIAKDLLSPAYLSVASLKKTPRQQQTPSEGNECYSGSEKKTRRSRSKEPPSKTRRQRRRGRSPTVRKKVNSEPSPLLDLLELFNEEQWILHDADLWLRETSLHFSFEDSNKMRTAITLFGRPRLPPSSEEDKEEEEEEEQCVHCRSNSPTSVLSPIFHNNTSRATTGNESTHNKSACYNKTQCCLTLTSTHKVEIKFHPTQQSAGFDCDHDNIETVLLGA